MMSHHCEKSKFSFYTQLLIFDKIFRLQHHFYTYTTFDFDTTFLCKTFEWGGEAAIKHMQFTPSAIRNPSHGHEKACLLL